MYVDLFDRTRPDLCIHPSANIHPSVSLGMGVVVDDCVVIGAGSRIWHHCVIRSGVIIGEKVTIGHMVLIEQKTTIGSGTTIQSQAHITALATIGKNVFIGPHTTLINEKRIASHGRKIPQMLKGPVIEDGARIGSHCLLMPESYVGEQGVVGAGSILRYAVDPRTYYKCRPCEIDTYPVPEEELLP